MGGARTGLICLIGLSLMSAACGSRQAPSPTTVTSGGAEVPAQAPAEVVPPTVVEAVPDTDFEEVDEDLEDPRAPVEDLPRRDLKMVSYEEAMARPVELGDVTSGGGEAQLTAGQVAQFMDDHLDEMYEECIQRELERGNELGTVTIDLAIRGKDGMVLGATIEPGRRRFRRCMGNYLEDIRFPRFASPRMGARYRFHAG